MKRFLSLFLALAVLTFFALFLFLPLFTVVAEGCDPAVMREVFRSRLYLQGMLNSLAVAAVTTLLVFLISIPLAALYDKYDFPGKAACSVMMMAPMILPPFVGALGFQQLLGHYGLLNSILGALGLPPVDWLGGSGRFWSVCVIQALHLYPIAYLNLVTAFGNIDPSLLESARNAGAGPWQRFRRITLPMLRPGLLAGGSIVLIWAFTELGTPLMFGYNTVTPVQIFNGVTELGTNPAAYSLVIITLAVSCLLYLGAKLLLGRGTAASVAKGTPGASARRLTGIGRWLPLAAFIGFTFVASLPHICLVLIASSASWSGTILPEHFSLMHYRCIRDSHLVVPSIVNSLKYALLATALALAAGVLTAFLTRRSRLKFGWLLDLVAMTPLMIPGVVMAVGFLGMSIRYRWAHMLFDPVANPVFLLAIAYAVRRVPYVLRSVAGGLDQTPEELERAARNAGAGYGRTLLKITLPLVAANLVVGALFAFSFSMMEVSDSLILAQKAEFYPITKAIYELSQYLGAGPYTAAAFGVWSMCFLASILAAASVLLGKKIGSLFSI